MSEEIRGTFAYARYAQNGTVIGVFKNGVVFIGPASDTSFIPGLDYMLSGKWETHPTHGRQFAFTSYAAGPVHTDAAVGAYLMHYVYGKGFGFGAERGRKVIAEYGPANTIPAMKGKPEEIAKLVNLPVEKVRKISRALIREEKHQETKMQLFTLLDGRGFARDISDAIVKDFGVSGPERIKRDPFTMLVRRYRTATFNRCDIMHEEFCIDRGKEKSNEPVVARLKRQMLFLWDMIDRSGGSAWIKREKAASDMGRTIKAVTNADRAIELGVRARWIVEREDEAGVRWLAVYSDALDESMVAVYAGALRRGKTDTGTTGSDMHDRRKQFLSLHREPRNRKDDNDSKLVEQDLIEI